MSQPQQLRDIQRWMQTVITHPEGIEAGIASAEAQQVAAISPEDVDRLVLPSQQCSSIERLTVYGNAYFARLLECMRDEYPAFVAAIGEDAFDRFAFDYIVHQPPSSYTLADLGNGFPDFLEQTRPVEDPDEVDWTRFLTELARLERDFAELFDGPGPETNPLLSADELTAVNSEQWPAARLVLAPWVRLRKFAFPVHEYASAVRVEGQSPPPPPAQPTYLVVSRREYVVRRTPVSSAQFALLQALSQGETVAGAITAAAERLEPDDLATLGDAIRRWFYDWAAAGFLVSVHWDERGT